MQAMITQLNIYPVKSCRGIALHEARLTAAGLEHDRRWMIVSTKGRFLTQRELPRLAMISVFVRDGELTMTIPGSGSLAVPAPQAGSSRTVRVWRDHCRGFDCGEDVARSLTRFLNQEVRLVQFDPSGPRFGERKFTAEIAAPVQFADGFPVLLTAEESLADLNGRLPLSLPMDRFRPNIVIRGLGPYTEDRVHELRSGPAVLRAVKPCMRCKITATDQDTADVDEREPLTTLKAYRWNSTLRGASFGQNLVVVSHADHWLRTGAAVEVTWRDN